MNRRVLFVDDEPNVLQAIRRAIRKDVDVSIAVGPEAGLEAIATGEEFAVIVSDMRMPGMNGVDFLRAARQLSPRSVRMMLTGNADQQTAIDAVNDGEVFRFLTKPCDVDRLRTVMAQALRQYGLQNAERELLEETLQGSLSVMTDLLALARPDAFGRTCRLRSAVFSLLEGRDDVDDAARWAIDTAIMLSQLGSVALPPDLIARINAAERLDEADLGDWQRATGSVADMLARVPRMGPVAEIVRYQHKHYDGGGAPADDVRAERIPLGARALRLAMCHDELRSRGYDEAEIAEELKARRREFDPRLLERVLAGSAGPARARTCPVAVGEIAVDMQLAGDLCSDSGSLIVCEGQRVTPAILEHLQRLVRDGQLTGTCVIVEESAPRAARAANY